eukprot:5095724-Amphidinium_carterae.1
MPSWARRDDLHRKAKALSSDLHCTSSDCAPLLSRAYTVVLPGELLRWQCFHGFFRNLSFGQGPACYQCAVGPLGRGASWHCQIKVPIVLPTRRTLPTKCT